MDYFIIGLQFQMPEILLRKDGISLLKQNGEYLLIILAETWLPSGKMRGEADKVSWILPNYGATYESSFSGLPPGHRNYDGTYSGIGAGCGRWSSTSYNTKSRIYSVGNTYISITKLALDSGIGFTVRCVKD